MHCAVRLRPSRALCSSRARQHSRLRGGACCSVVQQVIPAQSQLLLAGACRCGGRNSRNSSSRGEHRRRDQCIRSCNHLKPKPCMVVGGACMQVKGSNTGISGANQRRCAERGYRLVHIAAAAARATSAASKFFQLLIHFFVRWCDRVHFDRFLRSGITPSRHKDVDGYTASAAHNLVDVQSTGWFARSDTRIVDKIR